MSTARERIQEQLKAVLRAGDAAIVQLHDADGRECYAVMGVTFEQAATIAAAPDLLKAARKMLAAQEEAANDPRIGGCTREQAIAFHDLKAAIAKAEGRATVASGKEAARG